MIDRRLLADRLDQAYKILLAKGKVHSKSDLAKAINKDPRALGSAFSNSGRAMTVGLLERVADAFPNILNREWLVEGKGEPELPSTSMRPHFEAKAAAGFMDGLAEGKMPENSRYLSFMNVDYDFSITASGSSMMPRIEDGDILLCRIVSDRMNVPVGKICVIDSKEGAAVKVIESVNPESETVTLHSLNPEYRDYEIDFSSIIKLARVVSLFRPNL